MDTTTGGPVTDDQAPALPHERIIESGPYEGATEAQALAMRWSEDFAAIFERAETLSDAIVLEGYYSTLAACRAMFAPQSAPHNTFCAFTHAVDTLMRQRVFQAGMGGFDAGYAAAVLALTGQPLKGAERAADDN
jgi:hypothetical protein